MSTSLLGTSAELARARAGVYSLLSQLLLAPPTEAALEKLREPSVFEGVANGLGKPALSAIEALGEGARGSQENVVQEYNDLFVVPTGRYIAPYEASYRSALVEGGEWIPGPLQGASTTAVLARYRDAGAQVPDTYPDLPDHVGMELAFMRFLCEAEAEAWDRSDHEEAARWMSMEQGFVGEHLAAWAPELCERIQEQAEGPFYKGVALLLKAFIAAEEETLAANTDS